MRTCGQVQGHHDNIFSRGLLLSAAKLSKELKTRPRERITISCSVSNFTALWRVLHHLILASAHPRPVVACRVTFTYRPLSSVFLLCLFFMPAINLWATKSRVGSRRPPFSRTSKKKKKRLGRYYALMQTTQWPDLLVQDSCALSLRAKWSLSRCALLRKKNRVNGRVDLFFSYESK